MKATSKITQAWLLAVAKNIASRLKSECVGTSIRIRVPARAAVTETDGWRAVIGDLGRGKPILEVWLDRYSGHDDRKLYVCLRSESRDQLVSITKRIARRLWPVRVITSSDVEKTDKHFRLIKRLASNDFNVPVLEKYGRGLTFYGVYDQTRGTTRQKSPHFCALAAAFFEDVARSLPQSENFDDGRDVYPRIENRMFVVSHLQRERSKLLALRCKMRDEYRCQVCGLNFEQRYGKLGIGFAEAHHLKPLSQLRGSVRTRLEDLATVCANCHRMLHRMDGKPSDLPALKKVVRHRKSITRTNRRSRKR